MEQYRDDADPTRVYVKESISTKKGVMVSRNYLYAHYKSWCEDKTHHPMSQGNFFKKLKIHLKDYSDKRTTIGKDDQLPSNCWYVENITFSKTALDKFKWNGGKKETKDCMIDAKSGFPIQYE